MKNKNYNKQLTGIRKLITVILLFIFYSGYNSIAAPVDLDNSTALVIIDVQNDYFPGGKYTLEGSKDACSVIKRVLQKFRMEKRLVVHVQHKDAGSYFVPGTEGQKIHSDLTPLPEEKLIVKTAPNSFYDTELEQYLKGLKIKTLIICGMQTNVCVEATTNDALSLGFSVYLMADGCSALQQSIHAQTIRRLGKTATLINSFDLINNVNKKPESIVFDYKSGNYYVSNPESGTVVKLSSTGIPEIALKGLTFPLGLTIMDSIIFVADSSRLKGFLLKDYSKVIDILISGASRLNGIASDGDSLVFATDDTNDKIFKINIKKLDYKVLIDNRIDFPNGIEYDKTNNRILFCESGSRPFISSFSLKDNVLDTLYKFNSGGMDGLAMDAKGNVYFSSWSKSGVFRCNPTFSSEPVQLTFDNYGPADIFYNIKDSIIAIPNMSGGTIDLVSCKYKINANDTVLADTRILICNDNLGTYAKTSPKFSVLNSLLNYGKITDSISVILPGNISKEAITVNYNNVQVAPSSAKSLLFTVDPSKFPLGTNKIDITINFAYSKTKQIVYTMNFEVVDHGVNAPSLKEGIEANVCPNPFSDYISFKYSLIKDSYVRLSIHNLNGQLVKSLVNCRQNAGFREMKWDGLDRFGNKLASGMFIYTLQIDDILKKGEIILVR